MTQGYADISYYAQRISRDVERMQRIIDIANLPDFAAPIMVLRETIAAINADVHRDPGTKP